jgi:hypothetical protein
MQPPLRAWRAVHLQRAGRFSVGSVHAVTRDGALFIASASGSQLASYAWGATNVILVVGAQKLVPTAEAARERIFEHSLKLEDARAYAAYGQNSFVGKILEIHQEFPAASTSSSSDSRSGSDRRIGVWRTADKLPAIGGIPLVERDSRGVFVLLAAAPRD